MPRKRYYVGVARELHRTDTVFLCATAPTRGSHGHMFNGVIGPFRTKRGAEFMARYGAGNPHCQCVADAERLAALEPENLHRS